MSAPKATYALARTGTMPMRFTRLHLALIAALPLLVACAQQPPLTE